MPTYEYRCDVCANEFEAQQPITETPIAECPRCRVCTDKRLISGGSFVLKGDGWAKDLYSSSKTKS